MSDQLWEIVPLGRASNKIDLRRLPHDAVVILKSVDGSGESSVTLDDDGVYTVTLRSGDVIDKMPICCNTLSWSESSGTWEMLDLASIKWQWLDGSAEASKDSPPFRQGSLLRFVVRFDRGSKRFVTMRGEQGWYYPRSTDD